MKNTLKKIGIIALAAVMGFAIIGCDILDDAISGETYTVTFNTNGGTSVPSATVKSGEKVTKPADPTKTGSTFGGWFKQSALTNQWNFTSDTVTSDITLHAKWTLEEKKYIIDLYAGVFRVRTGTYGSPGSVVNQPYAPGTVEGAINAIRADAGGMNCEIYFDNLNVGTTTVNLSSYSTTVWGVVTLRGTITGTVAGSYLGTVKIGGGASDPIEVISYANILNNSTENKSNSAIFLYTSKSITVESGTIECTTGDSISNSLGNIIIKGGELKGGVAVYAGEMTMTGGKITTPKTGVHLVSGTTTTVKINGGEIAVTDKGNAVYLQPAGLVEIGGDAILSSENGVTVVNGSTGRINIGGKAKISSDTGVTVENEAGGEINISGTVEITNNEVLEGDYSKPAIRNSGTGKINLADNPEITGFIQLAVSGTPKKANLFVMSSLFTPSPTREYFLEFGTVTKNVFTTMTYEENMVAVQNGKNFLDYFSVSLLSTTAEWKLAVSGDDLIITKNNLDDEEE